MKLRYAANRAEFEEALPVLRELLPRDSAAREGLVSWVRSMMIDHGAKEEDVAKVRQVGDLTAGVAKIWLAEDREKNRREVREEGRREGRKEAEAHALLERRATLVRLARRKFDAETAKELGALLERVSASEHLAEIADLIIDCATGQELLAHANTAA